MGQGHSTNEAGPLSTGRRLSNEQETTLQHEIKMTVNGKAVSGSVEARTLLVQFIREHLKLTGTHVGCDTTQCGCCVVHVDGKAMKSCTMLAVQANGTRGNDDRGAGRRRRHAASDAGRVPGAPRPAVRLLHAGHGDDGRRHRQPPSERGRGDRAPPARRQHLPLHRATRASSRRSWTRAARWRGEGLRTGTRRCAISPTHVRPSVNAAAARLKAASEPRLLAGGMSLLPSMKLRLAAPSDLVDLGDDRRAEGHQGRGQGGRRSAP